MNFCSLAAVPTTCGVHSVFRSDPKRREQEHAPGRGGVRGGVRGDVRRGRAPGRGRVAAAQGSSARPAARAVSPPRAPLLDQEPGGVSSASAHAATARVQVRARAGRAPPPRPGTRCDRARGADRKHQPPRPSRACPSRSLYSASLGRDPQESLQPAPTVNHLGMFRSLPARPLRRPQHRRSPPAAAGRGHSLSLSLSLSRSAGVPTS